MGGSNAIAKNMDNSDNRDNGDATDPERIKVVDRQGNVKFIPRSEYEAKKRRRKRRESQKNLPVKEIISIIFILAAILAASYLALYVLK